MTLQQKFEKFLKNNKAYSSFKNNIKEYKLNYTITKHFDAIGNNPKRIMTTAFVYADTSQGHRYWRDLEIKWLQQIKEVENN